MKALLSAAAKCFRAWVSVEILWRGVLLPLLAVAGKCYRAQPLINIEGATKDEHGMTCAAELFGLRHVRSCAASAFWKSIHMFRNELRHMHARWLGDTENHNEDAQDGSADPTTQWTRVGGGQVTPTRAPVPRHQNRRRHRRHDCRRQRLWRTIVIIIIVVSIPSSSSSAASSQPRHTSSASSSSSSISDRPKDIYKKTLPAADF